MQVLSDEPGACMIENVEEGTNVIEAGFHEEPVVVDYSQAGPFAVKCSKRIPVTVPLDAGTVILQVQLTAPAGTTGPCPLVHFYNGFQISLSSYESYAWKLASWGYVVLQYDLPGLLFKKIVKDDVELTVSSVLRKWALEHSADPGSVVHGLLDDSILSGTNVATVGHSRGGKLAALMLAGDPTVRASAFIDPVDMTPQTVSLGYPSAVDALQTAGRNAALIGAGLCGMCNPTEEGYHKFWPVLTDGSWQMVVSQCGHMQFTSLSGFSTWFKEEHRGCYQPLDTVRADHLYVDMNCVLAIHRQLDQILHLTRPRKAVVLAVDGPGPLAKLLRQRERRKSRCRPEHEYGPSNNAITPGTSLMLDITLSLVHYIWRKLASGQYEHVQFELSDATVPGEGEIKMLWRMAHPWREIKQSESHVIVGDDSDLIMIALLSRQQNVHLIPTAIAGPAEALSINKVEEQWQQDLELEEKVKEDKQLMFQLKCDFVLIVVLGSGNDYIPGLSGAKLAELRAAYKNVCSKPGHATRTIAEVAKDGTPHINLQILSEVMMSMGSAKGESTPLLNEEKIKEQSIKLDESTLKPSVSPDHDLEASRSYLYGLVWMLQMYVCGQCPDYHFSFDQLPPTGQDLVRLCHSMEVPFAHLSYYASTLSEEASSPLPPFACGLVMLPPECKYMLIKPVQALMEAEELDFLNKKCESCSALKEKHISVSSSLLEIRNKVSALKAAIENAAGDEDHQSQLSQKMQAAKEQEKQLKEMNKASRLEKYEHMQSAHPLTRFPSAKIEALIARVPATSFQAVELPLSSFGNSHVFCKAENRNSGPTSNIQGDQSQQQSSLLCQLPPPPPPFSIKKIIKKEKPVAHAVVREPSSGAQRADLTPAISRGDKLSKHWVYEYTLMPQTSSNSTRLRKRGHGSGGRTQGQNGQKKKRTKGSHQGQHHTVAPLPGPLKLSPPHQVVGMRERMGGRRIASNLGPS